MANPPPPYTNITGISRAAMKDNAQITLVSYDGNARPGEIVVNLAVDPPTVFVGNNAGELTQLSTGGGTYGDANVVTLLDAFGSNTITTTGNITATRLQNDGNLEIRSNVAGTIKNWTFDTLGDFNMPVGGNISGSGLITANRVSATGNIAAAKVILTNGAVIKDTAGNAVAFGQDAGVNSQGDRAVAIGLQAGETTQGVGGIAIGERAGQTSQGVLSVAIGYLAGANTQSFSAVAIGAQAGETAQGSGAIAIGDLAGRTSQASNSIIINATGANLDQTTANTFTVKPVRAVTSVTFAAPTAGSVPAGFSPMYYNPTTGEIIVITT